MTNGVPGWAPAANQCACHSGPILSLGILKSWVSKYCHLHPLGASLQPISMHAIVALYFLKSRVSKYHCAYIYTRQYTPPDLSRGRSRGPLGPGPPWPPKMRPQHQNSTKLRPRMAVLGPKIITFSKNFSLASLGINSSLLIISIFPGLLHSPLS